MDLNGFFRELDSKFKTKNISEVEAFVISSLERAQREENIPAIVAIANELGGIYRVTSRLEQGKKVYAIALQGIKALDLENTEQHGTTLLNLASVYLESKESEEALKLYERVAVIFRQAGLDKTYKMAALYNNISHAWDELNHTAEALKSAETALEIIKYLPDNKVELATTHTTLATRYIKQKRYTEAETNLSLAEKIFSSLPGKADVHYAATLNTLGEFYFIQRNYTLASTYFQRALELIKKNYGENIAYEEVCRNLNMVKSLSNKERLSGLALAENFYQTVGRKMVEENFSEYNKYMAFGLAGEGSECLGFDDEISEDHDFIPGFCIWLPEEIFQKIGAELQKAYEHLQENQNFKQSLNTLEGKNRTGVFSIEGFYKKYIRYPGIPNDNIGWLFTNEISLSTATNGKVFQDNLGEFTRIRSALLDFYPKDVYLKKIAARMAKLSQSGQYNYERCMKRGDSVAAYLSCSEFIKTAGSIVYLLNHTYMPFYKWMYRGMDQLKNLSTIRTMLQQLIIMPDLPENVKQKVGIIENICIEINKELNKQGIISGSDPFLGNHCKQVMRSISDSKIKELPVIFDVE